MLIKCTGRALPQLALKKRSEQALRNNEDADGTEPQKWGDPIEVKKPIPEIHIIGMKRKEKKFDTKYPYGNEP